MFVEVMEPVSKQVLGIRVQVPVRYDDDVEALGDLPFLRGRTLTMDLDFEERRVRDWPEGRVADIHLKVVDEGSYTLLGVRDEHVKALSREYVPDCLPGEHYGDYLMLSVDGAGNVAGWNPTPRQVVESFWRDE